MPLGNHKKFKIIFFLKNFLSLVNLSLYQMIACLFAIGMAFGVIVAVGMLFFVQVRKNS